MKMAFATCVRLGLSCIEEIYRIGGQLDLLITLNDEKAKRKSGRIYLDDFANSHHIPLLKINNINETVVIEELQNREIDWLFIIGWSQVAKSELLSAPKRGCIGMHPSLLPEGRGRASIPWAILKGLRETGVTLFKLDEGVDTGPIIGQIRIPISQDETATSLYKKVNDCHVELISQYWPLIVRNEIKTVEQDHDKATVWPGRKPEDGEIFQTMTMSEAERMVRAVTHPYPGAFFRQGDRILRIWSAKVDKEQGSIRLADGYLTPIDYEIEG